MALNGLNIQITVNAPGVQQTTSTVTQGLNQIANAASGATGAVGKMRGEFVQVAGAFTGLLVGKQILGMLGAFAGKTDAITTGMAKIRSVTQLQGNEEDSLKKKIFAVSEATGNSFADVAEASKNLLAQSLNPAQVEAVLQPLFKLSKVGDLGTESATNLIVALGNMGVMGEKISPAFDIMLNLSNKSSLNVKDFTEVLTKAGPAAANLGIDFKDLAQTAALLRKGFSSGAEEGTALSNALTAMTNPKKLKALQDTFNVDVINRATGQMKPLMQIWQQVAKAVGTTAVDQGKLTQIFGSRTGARVFATAIGSISRGMQFGDTFKQGDELMKSMRDETMNSAGTLDKSFSERMMTLTESLNQLKSAADNLLGVLGVGLATTLTTLITGLTGVITNIREWLMANPMIASTLSTILGLLAQLAAGFGIFLMLAGGAKLLSFGIMFINTSFAAMRTVMLEGALAATTTAAGLLGVGGSAGVATLAVRGLQVAAKGLWRALLGPFGLFLILFDVLPAIGRMLGFGSSTADKTMDTAKTMKMSSDSLNDSAVKLNDAASVLETFSANLKESIAMYTGALVKKPMVIDVRQEKIGMQVAEAYSKATGTPMKSLTPLVQSLAEETKQAQIAAASGGKYTIPIEVTNRASFAQRVLGGQAALLGGKYSKQHQFFQKMIESAEAGASYPNTLQAATQRYLDQGVPLSNVFGNGVNRETTDQTAADMFRQQGVNVPAPTTVTRAAPSTYESMTHKAAPSREELLRHVTIDSAQVGNMQFNGPMRLQIGDDAEISAALKTMHDRKQAQGFGVP